MGGAVAVLLLLMTAGPSSASLISTTDTLSRPGYTIVTFNSGSGLWTVPTGVSSLEVLLVGGGGSGGGTYSTGGGAGGVVYYGPETVTNYLLTPQSSYSVTAGTDLLVIVGAGGLPKATLDQGAGNSGSNSQFDNVIAKGGQYGDSPWNNPGGQAGYVGGTPYQGYAGGNTSVGGAGAGGGAGGVGGVDQRGGIGLQIGITGTATYYGGGGGGIGAVNSSYNLGGLGGGGNGSASDGGAATAGLANTGGGGGGHWGVNDVGGAGGSGVVIVAYQAIPEPTSGLLLIVGAAGLGLLRRKLRS